MVKNRTLLVSTGTMVGRSNGYDYRGALREIKKLADDGFTAGLELMMLPFYYDKLGDVVQAVNESGVTAATIHCEKNIGTLLSDAAVAESEGRSGDADETYTEAIRLFELNCKAAEMVGVSRMVLHLWGGLSSDSNIEYNISKIPALDEIAKCHGVRILYENIPSNHADPLSNWKKLLKNLGGGGLIFDTRFGKLHEQIREILTDSEVLPHIEHVHISDFVGGYRNFEGLRPIPHPGEGVIDFDEVAALLDDADYCGTFTLESPIMSPDDGALDVQKIKNTLEYLKKLFHIK